ncbi:MAG TPA: hypothetical protein VFS11_01355 [Gemmatimonadales bacterium]|nr:hypothetical protein [Gemmatimonadales bacterium]
MSAAPEDLAEPELDRRLRRVDWRFLLPTPHPRRTLFLASGMLADALALVSGEVVSEAEPGSCDLAVAQDPDEATLARLWTALRPGGACVTEWRRPRVRGAARASAALAAAGFEQVACYWPWPASSAGRPRYWIPLDAPGAAAYLRARDAAAGNRLQRLAAATARRARDAALTLGYTPPVWGIALRPPAGADAPAAWLRAGWSQWGLGAPPTKLSRLLLTGGPRSVSKVVTLVFDEPDPHPRLAIKAPRVPASFLPLRREAAALEALGRRAPSARRSGVPRYLFLREDGGVPLVGESAVVGRPLELLLTRDSLRSWAMQGTDWLVDLAGSAPARSAAQCWHAVVQPVLGDIAAAFGPVLDPGSLERAAGVLRELGDLPPVCEQRDFAPWNVLVSADGELAVLDWESAAVEGLPALDLLYFLAHLTFNVDRATRFEDRIASHRRALDPATPTGAVRRDCLARYFERLGLAPAQLRPLQVLVWLIHARSDFQHFVADAGGPPSTEMLRRSLFLALWREEMRVVTNG